ncbi:MAG: hypothetical protein JWP44_5012 [Mucilaginibacter sp.]|nr:hypothetical protein [Mucilaginibacter sp.]
MNIREKSVNDICSQLSDNYAELMWQSFKSEEEFLDFLMSTVKVSYNIGYRDATNSKKKTGNKRKKT